MLQSIFLSKGKLNRRYGSTHIMPILNSDEKILKEKKADEICHRPDLTSMIAGFPG